MAIPSVFQSHVFGLSAEVRDNVHFLDEQTIIYPAGTQLVIFNSEQKTQRFLNVSDGDGITALAVNAAGTMAAVAVKAGSHLPGTSDGLRRGSHLWSGSVVPSSTPPAGEASLLLYDLQTGRKKKTLTPGSSDAKEFFSVSFSPDAKYVLAQSAGPDWTLYIWDWDKSKLRGTAKTTNIGNVELNDMTVNLLEASSIHVCISGNTLLRTYRHTEGNWKLLHQLKSDKNLLCNTFLSETTILCGTEDGKLLIFDSGEQVGEIQYALINTDDDIFIQPAITSIKSMPTSLLVGNSTGTCMLFEKSEDGSWKKTKEFSTEEAAVGSISVSPAEESAVISLMNSQLYHLPLDAEGPRNAKIQCNPMIQPFHNGAISGMDVASRKPLLATCGVDKSVRVWNFSENTCEVRKVFEEEPLSVAVHPTGLYILVGFSESIKLMNVLVDDVRPFWEVSVRGCRECRFSNGGQYFAVVHGLTIIVYHMWTLQVACHLKAHKAKVRSLNWSADDSHLLSCGMDGAMYDWDLRSTKRETEILATGVLFTQAVHTSDMKLIYVVGSDGVMKEISDGHVTREVHTKGPLTHLVMSRNGRMCFAGKGVWSPMLIAGAH
ncbi:quinon protein alcohol dehydrogenase-like superfamily [Gaertneriomyces semiglobifer]|nr:quinon protein alcohol dehydrogenase-like superfamily [Gaertneriomyces semiglobifer]